MPQDTPPTSFVDHKLRFTCDTGSPSDLATLYIKQNKAYTKLWLQRALTAFWSTAGLQKAGAGDEAVRESALASISDLCQQIMEVATVAGLTPAEAVELKATLLAAVKKLQSDDAWSQTTANRANTRAKAAPKAAAVEHVPTVGTEPAKATEPAANTFAVKMTNPLQHRETTKPATTRRKTLFDD